MIATRLKACPRCHGDLIIENEENGPERVCLQCGYRKPPDNIFNDKLKKKLKESKL